MTLEIARERTLLKRIALDFDLADQYERLLDRERDAELGLMVMIIGEGNFGKSSLINALCGREVAPVSAIPLTWKIDVYRSGEESATLRRKGEVRGREMGHEEARELAADAERIAKGKGGTHGCAGAEAPIVEIVWSHPGLDIPKEIVVVDTPGLAQALGDNVRGKSLTSILGGTFEVDEVWAEWFHRADVALWAFTANKLESEETRAALDAALRLFGKRILPVATKGDAVPPERWDEVRSRFEALYSDRLADQLVCPLQIVVAGGRSPLRGEGVAELRSLLTRLAGEASESKTKAELAYLQDEAKGLGKLLRTTGEGIVANLREIATVGDELALRADEVANGCRKAIEQEITRYLSGVGRSDEVDREANRIFNATSGGRALAETLATHISSSLDRIVDSNEVDRICLGSIRHGAHELSRESQRLARARRIKEFRFRASGSTEIVTIPLRMDLDPTSFRADLKLSSSFATTAASLLGLLGKIVVKIIFGTPRETIADQIRLALKPHRKTFENINDQVLFKVYAPAIQKEIWATMNRYLDGIDAEVMEKLSKLDGYDSQLARFDTAITRDEAGLYPRAKYWSMIAPDVEVLKEIARTIIQPQEENLRLLPASKLVLPRMDLKQVRKDSLAGSRVLKDGRSYGVMVSLTHAFREAVRIRQIEPTRPGGDTRWISEPYGKVLQDEFVSMIRASPIFVEMTAASTSGQKVVSVGRVCEVHTEIALKQFWKAFNQTSLEYVEVSVRAETAGRIPLMPGTKLFMALFATGLLAVAWSFRPVLSSDGRWLASVTLGFGALSVVFVGSHLLVRTRLFLAFMPRIESELQRHVRAAQVQTSEDMPTDLVDQIVRAITVELVPRPLQRLVQGINPRAT